MQSIKVRSRVGADGMLHLQVPVGIKDIDLEVIVVFQRISCSAFKLHSQNLIKFLWGGPYSPHEKCNLDVEQLSTSN